MSWLQKAGRGIASFAEGSYNLGVRGVKRARDPLDKIPDAIPGANKVGSVLRPSNIFFLQERAMDKGFEYGIRGAGKAFKLGSKPVKNISGAILQHPGKAIGIAAGTAIAAGAVDALSLEAPLPAVGHVSYMNTSMPNNRAARQRAMGSASGAGLNAYYAQ